MTKYSIISISYGDAADVELDRQWRHLRRFRALVHGWQRLPTRARQVEVASLGKVVGSFQCTEEAAKAACEAFSGQVAALTRQKRQEQRDKW